MCGTNKDLSYLTPGLSQSPKDMPVSFSWLENETGIKSKKVTFYTITFFDQPPIPYDDTALEGLTKMCFSTVTYHKTDKTSMYCPCFCHN